MGLCDPRGRAPSCLPLKSKGGAAVAELRRRREHGAPVLDYSEDLRAGGPPRVTVHIARPAGEWAPEVLLLWPSC